MRVNYAKPSSRPVQTVHFLLRPICYRNEGEAATPFAIKEKCSQIKGSIRKMSYLTLGGIISSCVGVLTAGYGFIKENTFAKWLGAIITFLGVESLTTGFLGGVDLTQAASKQDRTSAIKKLLGQFFGELKAGETKEKSREKAEGL